MKILIVDDHIVLRQGLKQILTDGLDKVEFGEAGDTARALEQLGRQRWDILVLDINLPGTSGLDYLRELVASGKAPPVIMITAHGSERTAVEAIKAGAYDYLAKPFEVEELIRVVHKLTT